MATNKILDATMKLVALLEPLTSADRAKVIQAAYVLLGDAGQPIGATATPALVPPGQQRVASQVRGGASEKEFFDAKQPSNKGEELAVAARFREETHDASASTKDELKAVFKAARRNFDDKHFARDLDNARTKGLFNRGSGAELVLSHYGQNYVDAMPDRDAIKGLRTPKGAGVRRTPSKRPAKTAAKKVK